MTKRLYQATVSPNQSPSYRICSQRGIKEGLLEDVDRENIGDGYDLSIKAALKRAVEDIMRYRGVKAVRIEIESDEPLRRR